jgi:membrane peptidoglycan carboxypeptidase
MSKKSLKKPLKIISIVFIVIITLSMIVSFSAYYYLTKDVKLDKSLLEYDKNNIQFYDDNDDLINTMKYNNDYLKIEETPTDLKNAFLSLEDREFYNHNGLNYKRIIGAIISNLKTKSLKEGASTITQQVIKNTHLSNEKTIKRKIQEAKLAYELERNYSKDEIFEIYLNIVYMGNNLYGVKDAAKYYFNKDCNELSLMECAVIAGIVKNPSKYSPTQNKEESIKRANIVLKCMLDNKKITEDIYNKTINNNIALNTDLIYNSFYNSYLNSAMYEASQILNLSSKELRQLNLTIYTYLDNEQQNIIYNTLKNDNFYIKNENGIKPDSSAILIDNDSGGISAYYSISYFDAYSLKRQPGSIFKPLAVYAPAIEKGLITPASFILDEQTSFNNYTPHNFKDTYYGWITVRSAIEKSLNIPAVKVLNDVGLDDSKRFLNSINISLNTKDNLAIALGGVTDGVSLIDISGGYSMLANYGLYKRPQFIKEIRDKNNKIIYKNRNKYFKVLNEDSAYLLTDMLCSAVDNGTSRKLSALSFNVAGKTGTVKYKSTDNNNDAWSASFTSLNTLVVWQGNVDNSSEKSLSPSITGGSYPSMVATEIYKRIYNKYYPEDFYIPDSVVKLNIDKISYYSDEHSLKLLKDFIPNNYGIEELFSLYNVPKEFSDKYDLPSYENVNLINQNSNLLLNINTKSCIKYKIYSIDTFHNEKLVSEFSGNGEIMAVNINYDCLFNRIRKIKIVSNYIEYPLPSDAIYIINVIYYFN